MSNPYIKLIPKFEKGGNPLDNKQKYISAVTGLNRPGIGKYLEWLEETDFYIAPASTKPSYHGCYPGGLLQHTLNVMTVACDLWQVCNKRLKNVNCTKESVLFCAALHDVCKINTYKPCSWKGHEKEYVVVDENYPLVGHGEKSLVKALQLGIDLNNDEMEAIRWHMGWFDSGAREYPSTYNFNTASKKPLVKIIQTADMLACLMDQEV